MGKWQSASIRAWEDTESFREDSRLWFWGVEIVGGAVFGAVGGLIGGYYTPSNATVFWQNGYPTIGGAIGVIVGFIMVFAVIYCVNLFHTPSPAKIKVADLAYQHIFRDGTPTNSNTLGHEYNFVGNGTIIPRIKEPLNEIYLEFHSDYGIQKVPCIESPCTEHVGINAYTQIAENKGLIGEVLDKPVGGKLFFQTLLKNEIELPTYGWIILKFANSTAKERVNLRLEAQNDRA